jgi:hypothetical protein
MAGGRGARSKTVVLYALFMYAIAATLASSKT